MKLTNAVAISAILMAVQQAFAASYVILQDKEEDSLVRVSTDGKSVTTIAHGAGGVGLAVDAAGNYIVGARTALLRVTPSGTVTKIADAPADSEWTALAIESAGSILVGDCRQPVIWRVSKDGTTVTKAATYGGLVYSAGGCGMAILARPAGDFLVLMESANNRLGPVGQFLHVTGEGMVTETPLRGTRVIKPTAITDDGNGAFLFADYGQQAILRLMADGLVSEFSKLSSCGFPKGLARNPENGDVVVTQLYCGSLATITRDGALRADLVRRGKIKLPTAIILELDR